MLLLPGAERERRALLLGAALAVCLGFAVWPQAPVDSFCRSWLGRAGRPLAAAAGLVARGWSAEATHGTPATPPTSWDAWERAAAEPAPLGGGLVWIPVPVREADFAADELLLAAGSREGLAPGMVVACGAHYVGRIAAVSTRSALVRGPAAVDERSGVGILRADGTQLEAIAIGRGRRAPPVLNWLEAGAEPDAGASVSFRGRANDPPELAAAGLLLGKVARWGDAQRGDRVWAVAVARAEAAAGRVCVAAGALPAQAVDAPEVLRTAAAPLLPADAVLGGRLSGWSLDGDFTPAVLVRGGRAAGPVVAAGGGCAWVRGDAPRAWGAAAVAVEGQWFTRGGAGVPRGLWIGADADRAPRVGVAEFLRLPPAVRPRP